MKDLTDLLHGLNVAVLRKSRRSTSRLPAASPMAAERTTSLSRVLSRAVVAVYTSAVRIRSKKGVGIMRHSSSISISS